jgi:hypothetical protein
VATERDRCSTRSLLLGESMIGTASTVSNWIMLEQRGPWGRDVLASRRLPGQVGWRLRALSAVLRVRIVFIRRYGRQPVPGDLACFVAHTGPDQPWLERTRLGSVADLFQADLSPLALGRPPGVGELDPGPLFLVCTHGRRDPCCAERGRPVARALHAANGDRAWEVSHIGGDRFAGNVVAFPHGLYFGRLEPAAAILAARSYEDGRIDLEHYRGRSCYSFAVQAAETFVRRRAGLAGVDDLRLTRARRMGSDSVEAEFEGLDGTVHRTEVQVDRADQPRVLTCHGTTPTRPPVYELLG